jgi:hypothetical protein
MSANLRTVGAAPRGAGATTNSPQPGRDPGDAAFDRWLHRELSRLYDQTLAEPVPDELLKLLNGAPDKDRPAKNGKDET